MNRKRKLNELCKGVFKNDKKSCLVDLKPLDQKREMLINEAVQEEKTKINKKKQFEVNLKVAKNLGFGSYFNKLREEIVEIFLAKDEYISFEGMLSQNLVDLFNHKESTCKKMIEKEKQIMQYDERMLSSTILRDQDIRTEIMEKSEKEEGNEDNEEILYENEEETIFKRKKGKSKVSASKLLSYYKMWDKFHQPESMRYLTAIDMSATNLNLNNNITKMSVNDENSNSNMLNFISKKKSSDLLIDNASGIPSLIKRRMISSRKVLSNLSNMQE